jgi:hypothetical protein
MALGGGLTVPSKSHQGFLPKGSELAALDTSLGDNNSTFSAEKVAWMGMGLLTVDLTQLEAQIPFRMDLSGGVLGQPAALGGSRLVWSGSLEWAPAPRLGLYAALTGKATLNRAVLRRPVCARAHDVWPPRRSANQSAM